MKKIYFLLIIVLLVVTCVEKPTETTTLGSVHGTVIDQSNNLELAGVTVSIQNVGNRTTDNNGYYEFKDLEEDIYTIEAEKAGYVNEIEQVEIEANKNKIVNFTLHIAQPAQLVVSPTSLNFGQTVYNLNISVNNGGDEELSWQVSSDQSWLYTFPTTGTTTTETDEIKATVNRASLGVGNYSGNLSFTSNGGDFNVPIQMEVTPVVLIIDPNSLDFGSEVTELFFSISNTGNGELNWSLTPDQSWITATPNSGSLTNSSETITVNVSRAGLAPDTYNGSISITSNGGNQDVSVTMIVPEGPAPVLEVSTASLDFGSEYDQLHFDIINSGDATLNWDISDNQTWVSVYPTSGTTNQDGSSTISVSVDRTGLTFGSYNGSINITSDGGNENIDVTMSIPFHETFENLDLWEYDNWTIVPSVDHFVQWAGYDYPNYLKISINVMTGQELSFWCYLWFGNPTLSLYFNNVLVWSQSGIGEYEPTVHISSNGTLEIKFIGSGTTSSDKIYMDDVIIE